MSKVAIGTAQFGLDYGVTNAEGMVTEREVGAILEFATGRGIDWLDTAHAYGTAEAVIGRLTEARPFSICTKIGASGATDPEVLDAELASSLERLGRQSVEIAMLHRSDALRGEARHGVIEWAGAQRERKRIGAFGVSVYSPDEAEAAIDAKVDWVQIPVSVLAQDWLAGGIDELRQAGIKVQARSLLAQGLVAADPALLPDELAAARGPLAALRAASEQIGVSPLDLALAFAAQLKVDMLVLGVQSQAQLQHCLSALAGGIEAGWGQFACPSDVIDPRRWPPNLRIRT